MKKILFFVLCNYCALSVFSQSFEGYGYDNYSGINSLLLNPAFVSGSKYKVNVNLASASVLAGNNAYEADSKKLFKLKFSNWQEGTDYFKSNAVYPKKLWFNTDVLGPSFMVTTGPKSAFGIITRMRIIGNEYNLSNNTFQLLGTANPVYYNVDIQEQNVRAKVHAFAEAGLTYGRILYQDKNHLFKAGITGKYIAGLGVMAGYSNNLLVNVAPGETINKLDGDVMMQYSANLDKFDNSNFSDVFNSNVGKKGWGLDAGIVYEWRRKAPKTSWIYLDPTPYQLRIGLSVTDIGTVQYDNSMYGKGYLVNADGHPTADLQKSDNETYEQYFTDLETNGILTEQSRNATLKVKLPTAVHANVDWHIFKRFFVNADALVNAINKTKNRLSANYITSFSVTPRMEKKWFSIYSPVSYNVLEQFSWGVDFRIGPLFAGSGSVLSDFLSSRVNAADFHVGLSIPIFQAGHVRKKKKKEEEKPEEEAKPENVVQDRDHDGVVDDKDDCPDSAGVVALNGCPDRDGDGVADRDDKCPDVAGSIKYQGCPIPDTDGDGINDEEDKCPTVRGTLENHGCPVIKQEVIRKVNSAAKSIYFVSGRAVIQSRSFARLSEIVDVLKADPTLQVTIEGHTDAVGSAESNQILSERRAQSVKDYFIAHGISATRLTSIGYGETKPVATNKTAAGRAKNRRVEMHLRNW